MINHYKKSPVEIELVPIKLLIPSLVAQNNAVYLASFIGNKSIGLKEKMSPEELNHLEGLLAFMLMESEAQSNTPRMTLIHWKQYDENIRPLISFLLNVSLDNGQTALHLAAKYTHNNSNNYSIVSRILIENHAKVDQKDNDGQTALHWAATYGRRDIMEVLIKHGADINAKRNDGATPVMLAADNRYYRIAKFLIAEHRANPDGIVLPTLVYSGNIAPDGLNDLMNAILNFTIPATPEGSKCNPSGPSNKPSS